MSVRFGAIRSRKVSVMKAAFVDGKDGACRPEMWERLVSLWSVHGGESVVALIWRS